MIFQTLSFFGSVCTCSVFILLYFDHVPFFVIIFQQFDWFSEWLKPDRFFPNVLISIILLMVQKSSVHQLRLVVYPIIYHGFFFTSRVVVWDFFFHQQYHQARAWMQEVTKLFIYRNLQKQHWVNVTLAYELPILLTQIIRIFLFHLFKKDQTTRLSKPLNTFWKWHILSQVRDNLPSNNLSKKSSFTKKHQQFKRWRISSFGSKFGLKNESP